jgi:predicted AAA+ superfamily ATPase
MYISRIIENSVRTSLANNPVVALTGPRQCGKSTLAKQVMSAFEHSIYLDLERPSDLQKLEEPEWFLSRHQDKLICIDEIQRSPDLFPIIRSLTDEWNRPGAFLILGSASRDLLRQSSETLAGRIAYKRMTPFLWNELSDETTLETYFFEGGFPRSILAKDKTASFEWRTDFISTFLERDLKQWLNFTPATMRRLWLMLAHLNGQTVDYSTIGRSMGVSNVTVKNYIDLLESTYMVEVVPAYFSNLGKRLVKSPKVYVADSGLQATLLGLRDFDALTGHPSFGAIWEQIVLSNIKGNFPNAEVSFYRTSNGAEVDFVVSLKNKTYIVECKHSLSPVLSKGNYLSIEDIAPSQTFVVAPVKQGWALKEGIEVVSLKELIVGLMQEGKDIKA